MKTTINVILILAVGVVAGLTIRQFRADSTAGPSPGETIYSNDNAVADNEAVKPEDVENDSPTKPPEDEEWLSRFELIERSGEKVSSEDLKGAPYVVSFFFSTCPSICVQQNQKIQELQEQFKDKGVKFVAISVDPETDTPEVLQEYSARFGADEEQWLFLTGDLNYIRRIGAEIFRQPVSKQFHTERFVLVDADGKVEGFYNWPEKKQFAQLQERISEMLEG
ncbi:SCO family protein [Rhodopirellula sallentina]|uniref:Electron transport protein SCO1/SenC n=1 Tax=Rhodopirellula sallentina SM41 TaxID=1263870 RepID=M5U927_9BACT|nr:SCO family protein [Rhodopirellula sallentina]EMI54361.1 electron transport protein SCO1/SenC [Rhodopirellula sallentina SM41]